MTKREDNLPDAKTLRSAWVQRALQLVLSTTIAAVTAAWSVRGYIADHDANVLSKFVELEKTFTSRAADQEKALARKSDELDSLRKKVDADIVPRKEHEAHWEEARLRHEELKSDIRELRGAVLANHQHALAE